MAGDVQMGLTHNFNHIPGFDLLQMRMHLLGMDKMDHRGAVPVGHRGMPAPGSPPGLDGHKRRLSPHARNNRFPMLGNAVDLPAQSVGNHVDRFRKSHMADDRPICHALEERIWSQTNALARQH